MTRSPRCVHALTAACAICFWATSHTPHAPAPACSARVEVRVRFRFRVEVRVRFRVRVSACSTRMGVVKVEVCLNQHTECGIYVLLVRIGSYILGHTYADVKFYKV